MKTRTIENHKKTTNKRKHQRITKNQQKIKISFQKSRKDGKEKDKETYRDPWCGFCRSHSYQQQYLHPKNRPHNQHRITESQHSKTLKFKKIKGKSKKLGLGFRGIVSTPGPESDGVPLLDLESLGLLAGRTGAARGLAGGNHGNVGIQGRHGLVNWKNFGRVFWRFFF